MIERRDCGKVEKYLLKEKLINLIGSITLIVNLKACLHLLFHFLRHIKPLPNEMSSTSLRKNKCRKNKKESCYAVPQKMNPNLVAVVTTNENQFNHVPIK